MLEQVRRPRVTMLDSMNFWIEGARDALTAALGRVDIVLMNEEEVRQYAGTPHLLKGARQILALGPQALIIKKGEYGAVLLHGEQLLLLPRLPPGGRQGPHRAPGDSFAGGFLGYLGRLAGRARSLWHTCAARWSTAASSPPSRWKSSASAPGHRDARTRSSAASDEFREFTYFDEV